MDNYLKFNDMPFQIISILILVTASSYTASAATIETVTVSKQSQPQWIELDARIEAVKAATVSAQTSGRIIKLNYDINDFVLAGASLLEITSKEQGAGLAAAEAEYASAVAMNVEAQSQRKRFEELYPQGTISQGSMDEALAVAKSAQQAVSAAKAHKDKAAESVKYTIVNAPFSGIVTQRHVEQGEAVNSGQPLFSGFSLEQMRAVVQVPQRYIEQLRQTPRFLVSTDNRQFSSDEITVFSFADPMSHSYKVRINLPKNEANLMPGMWAKAKFNAGNRTSLLVPKSSLIKQNELSAVYLRQQDGFVLNQVRLGNSQNDKVEILAGLNDGDIIAKDAYHYLQSKQTK